MILFSSLLLTSLVLFWFLLPLSVFISIQFLYCYSEVQLVHAFFKGIGSECFVSSLDECYFPWCQGTGADSRWHIPDSPLRQLVGITPWRTSSETSTVHKDILDVLVNTLWINLDVGSGIDFFLPLCLMAHYRFCGFLVICSKTPKFLTRWVLQLVMFVVKECHGPHQTKRLACHVVVTRSRGCWHRSSQTFLCSWLLCTDFWRGYFYLVAFFHVSSIVVLLFCGFASTIPLREASDQVGDKSNEEMFYFNTEFWMWIWAKNSNGFKLLFWSILTLSLNI